MLRGNFDVISFWAESGYIEQNWTVCDALFRVVFTVDNGRQHLYLNFSKDKSYSAITRRAAQPFGMLNFLISN